MVATIEVFHSILKILFVDIIILFNIPQVEFPISHWSQKLFKLWSKCYCTEVEHREEVLVTVTEEGSDSYTVSRASSLK